MSAYFLHIELKNGVIKRTEEDFCFKQLSDTLCDAILTHQTSNTFVGIRYRNTESKKDSRRADSKEGTPLRVLLDGNVDNLAELLPGLSLPQSVSQVDSLLSLYRAYGTDFFDKLRGRFSLLIINTTVPYVYLYRSKLGQMPLVYSVTEDRIFAASEERAIVAHPWFSCELDELILTTCFTQPSTQPTGHTVFKNISQLLPGECLSWNRGKIKKWRTPLQFGQTLIRYSNDNDYAEHYRTLMEQTVARFLPKSGPVGIMLSSGVDSAPAAAIAAKLLKKRAQPFKAYSWSLEGFRKANESEQINQVAAFADIDLQLVPANDYWPLYDHDNVQITANNPISNAFQGLKDCVLEAASADGCRTILNGWFGDRLFMCNRRDLISDAFHSGQTGLAISEFLYWMQEKGWTGVSSGLVNRLKKKLPFGSASQQGFLSDRPWLTVICQQQSFNENWPPEAEQHAHPDHFRMLTDQSTFHYAGNGKVNFGRFGIEPRYLYQDEEMIDFMLSIPVTQLRRLGQTKYIARNAARGLIPENIRLQSRVGRLNEFYNYGLWQRERNWLQERLFDTQCSWDEYINKAWLTEQFKKEQPSDRAGMVAWQCLTYELWLEKVRELERQKAAFL